MNGPILQISPVSKIAFLQFPVDFEKNHVEFDARISMWECGKVVGIKIWPFGDLWYTQIQPQKCVILLNKMTKVLF